MTHLTPDEVIDAVENILAPERRRHLSSCERCRLETAALTSILGEAQTVGAFEPSPLFWDHLSDRVRTAIAAEAEASHHARRWFDWPVLAPLAALALLVVALVASMPLSMKPDEQATVLPQLTSTEALDGADNEERWALMFELMGDVDLDAVVDSGLLGRPGTAEGAIAHLSSIEREELVRLLREELRAGG
jgi:hypothetical protein